MVVYGFSGNFTKYQELKARQLADEAKSNAEFDKLLTHKEVWIRKGVEARRTRNERARAPFGTIAKYP